VAVIVVTVAVVVVIGVVVIVIAIVVIIVVIAVVVAVVVLVSVVVVVVKHCNSCSQGRIQGGGYTGLKPPPRRLESALFCEGALFILEIKCPFP